MLKEIKAGKFRKLMDSILRKSIGYPREFLSGLCNIGFNFDDEKQDNGIISVVCIGSEAIQKKQCSSFSNNAFPFSSGSSPFYRTTLFQLRHNQCIK